MKNLTEQEQNVLKDILKHIGNDVFLNREIAKVVNLSEVEFDAITDSVFRKLGNGRVTVANEMPEEDTVRHLGDDTPANWDDAR